MASSSSSSQETPPIEHHEHEEDNACPICLCDPSSSLAFVKGPCGHAVCRPCMERILLTPQSHHAYQNNDSEMHIPTRGKCPICRYELNMFELIIAHKEAVGDEELAYPKNINVAESPIGGSCYAPQELGGAPSFHFDEEVPYMLIPTAQEQDNNDLRVPFETFHWHQQSQTFHGTARLQQDETIEWDVILQFSFDLRYISNGIIVKTRHDNDERQVHRLGPTLQLYRRVQSGIATTSSMPIYHGESLWGNTFCQVYKVGLASYHFVSPERGGYISYEHPFCSRWPPLDDGSPVPSQVYFQNTSFHEAERVFCGTIEWQEQYGTTWQGCRKWIYNIKFDSQYTCIVSGGVKSVLHGHDEDDAQDMCTFGVDLVYINAAILEKYEALMNDSIENGDEQQLGVENAGAESDYERHVRVSQSIRSRIQREGASVRTVAAMNHVLTATQLPDSEPIEYNL